jgi:hypothetical protein
MPGDLSAQLSRYLRERHDALSPEARLVWSTSSDLVAILRLTWEKLWWEERAREFLARLDGVEAAAAEAARERTALDRGAARVLERVEWGGPWGRGYCPDCLESRGVGHTPRCGIAWALGRPGAEPWPGGESSPAEPRSLPPVSANEIRVLAAQAFEALRRVAGELWESPRLRASGHDCREDSRGAPCPCSRDGRSAPEEECDCGAAEDLLMARRAYAIVESALVDVPVLRLPDPRLTEPAVVRGKRGVPVPGLPPCPPGGWVEIVLPTPGPAAWNQPRQWAVRDSEGRLLGEATCLLDPAPGVLLPTAEWDERCKS